MARRRRSTSTRSWTTSTGRTSRVFTWRRRNEGEVRDEATTGQLRGRVVRRHRRLRPAVLRVGRRSRLEGRRASARQIGTDAGGRRLPHRHAPHVPPSHGGGGGG